MIWKQNVLSYFGCFCSCTNVVFVDNIFSYFDQQSSNGNYWSKHHALLIMEIISVLLFRARHPYLLISMHKVWLFQKHVKLKIKLLQIFISLRVSKTFTICMSSEILDYIIMIMILTVSKLWLCLFSL